METVVCQLCNATIRAGSLHNLQLHMETSHDVTENTDLVIALIFLDSQEREVIIDQVIPRMKNILDNDNRSFSCENPRDGKDSIIEAPIEVQQGTKKSRDQEGERRTNAEDKVSQQTEVSSKLLKCFICEEWVKKYKFSRHIRNCKILQKHKLFKGKVTQNIETKLVEKTMKSTCLFPEKKKRKGN